MELPQFLKHLPISLEELPESFLKTIDERVRSKSFKKGEVIQHQGDKEIKTYYVKKGILRSYTIDAKGKEHVYMFAPENWVISDVNIGDKSQDATLYIDCIEDAEVEVISDHVMDSIQSKVLEMDSKFIQIEFERLFRRIGVLQNRIVQLLGASTLERYEYFVDRYPDIVQRVPQRMIASYLGVTPEALSKIKNQALKSGR